MPPLFNLCSDIYDHESVCDKITEAALEDVNFMNRVQLARQNAEVSSINLKHLLTVYQFYHQNCNAQLQTWDRRGPQRCDSSLDKQYSEFVTALTLLHSSYTVTVTYFRCVREILQLSPTFYVARKQAPQKFPEPYSVKAGWKSYPR